MPKNYGSSGTSNYSTCSEKHNGNINEDETLHTSLQSTILAGQIIPDYEFLPNNDTINERTLRLSFLDKNLDAFSEDDIFVDCNCSVESNSNQHDNTTYVPIQSMSKLLKTKSNNCYKNFKKSNKSNVNDDLIKNSSDIMLITSESDTEKIPLITIIEESEGNYINNSVKNKFSTNIEINLNNPKTVEIVNRIENSNNDNSKKNSFKRVLFADESNTHNIDIESMNTSEQKLNQEQMINPFVGKDDHIRKGKKTFEKNCKNNSKQGSVILWQKFSTAGQLDSRKSISLSELNSYNGNSGDDEYSKSSQVSVDDMSLHILKNLNIKDTPQRKNFRRRSKSCESLLKDVKHLPHILYDRVLTCLANEIDHIRKQNINCTCRKSDIKYSNKENITKSPKSISSRKIPSIKFLSEENKLSFKDSATKSITNQTKLSPELLKKTPPQNSQRLSPKSSTKKRNELYSWRKEIVSPVGEYIKGKRQSPFKNSPSKKT